MIMSLTHGSFPNGDRSNFNQTTDRPGSDSRPEFQFQLVTTEHRELTVNFHRDETIGILKVSLISEILTNSIVHYFEFFHKGKFISSGT